MHARRFKPVVASRSARQVRARLVVRHQRYSQRPPDTPPDSAPAHWPQPPREPPAHWLELVRAQAPGLLDGTGRGVFQTPSRRSQLAAAIPPAAAPALQVTPTGKAADTGETHPAGADLPRQPAIEPPAVPAGPRSRRRLLLQFSENTELTAHPPVYTTPGRRRPQPLIIYSPDITPPARTNSATAPVTPTSPSVAAIYGDATAAERSAWIEPPRAESVTPPALTISSAPAAQPAEPAASESPSVPVTVFPRYSELAPPTRPTAPAPSSLPAAQQPHLTFNETHPLPPVKYMPEPPLEGIWPSLPESAGSPETDESVISRAWKWRDRLDREQRGLAWSEPLS